MTPPPDSLPWPRVKGMLEDQKERACKAICPYCDGSWKHIKPEAHPSEQGWVHEMRNHMIPVPCQAGPIRALPLPDSAPPVEGEEKEMTEADEARRRIVADPWQGRALKAEAALCPSTDEKPWMQEWRETDYRDRDWIINTLLHRTATGPEPDERGPERKRAARLAINVLAGWDGYSLALEGEEKGCAPHGRLRCGTCALVPAPSPPTAEEERGQCLYCKDTAKKKYPVCYAHRNKPYWDEYPPEEKAALLACREALIKTTEYLRITLDHFEYISRRFAKGYGEEVLRAGREAQAQADKVVGR